MHYRLLSLVTVLTLVPAAAFALDYANTSGQYTDTATFSVAEKAAINVLTNEGVVAGNPDGTFQAARTLNRAEFVKIALLTRDSVEAIDARYSASTGCFPDVPVSAWFAPYVCIAQEEGILAGYPDGYFRPDQPVNYAEALKILANIFEYGVSSGSGDQWYRPYAEAARDRGTALPVSLSYGSFLTRGQMARLAAAFMADEEGELARYRAAERGQTASRSSSVSSSATSMQSSAVSSVAVSSSPSSTSSVAAVTGFPATSHFLMIGEWTPPMLDGTFLSADEDANVRLAELKFRREIRSLEEVWLVDSKGTKLQKFLIATDDVEKRTWKIPADSGTGFVLKKGVPTVLGVVAKLKSRDTGGASQELIEIERFAVGVTGATSLQSREIVPTDQHYPLHQTAQAILTKVTNNLQNAGSLPAGTKKLIGGFTFSGRILPGVQLRLSEVTLRAQKKGVTLSRIRIGGATEVQQTECGVESADPGLIECVALPESLQEVIAGSGRTLQVYADVALTGADPSPTLQLTLEKAGSLGVEGSVKWTDGSGRFNWIEGTSPLARSTLWSVTQ